MTIRMLAWFWVLLGLAGCVTSGTQTADRDLYWPAPPVQPRYVWETVIQSPDDVEIKPVGERETMAEVLGTKKDKRQVFAKPVRVAAAQGRIFVTDSMSKLVHVFDAPRRRYFQFGIRREGTLKHPLGVAVDRAGFVYVVDADRKTVVVYDSLGLWVRFIGDEKVFNKPNGVAVSPDGERIYVTDNGRLDSDRHVMLIFDKEGKTLTQVGARGAEDGQFNYPIDVATGPDGRVYVLDAGNFRVQVFDRDGKFLHKWGSVGRGLGQFARPRALTVDKDGHIYVVDASFVNIQVFNDEGKLLLPLGERAMQGDGPGLFSSPAGVATDETGRVYIVDQWLKKVEVLRKLSDEEGKKILSGDPRTAEQTP